MTQCDQDSQPPPITPLTAAMRLCVSAVVEVQIIMHICPISILSLMKISGG